MENSLRWFVEIKTDKFPELTLRFLFNFLSKRIRNVDCATHKTLFVYHARRTAEPQTRRVQLSHPKIKTVILMEMKLMTVYVRFHNIWGRRDGSQQLANCCKIMLNYDLFFQLHTPQFYVFFLRHRSLRRSKSQLHHLTCAPCYRQTLITSIH